MPQLSVGLVGDKSAGPRPKASRQPAPAMRFVTLAVGLAFALSSPAAANLVVDFDFETPFLPVAVFSDIGDSNIDMLVFASQQAFRGPGLGFATSFGFLDFDGPGSPTGPGLGVVGFMGGVPGDDDLAPPLGSFSRETVFFSFFEDGQPVEVSLQGLSFSNVDGNDNFDLLLDGDLYQSEIPIAPDGEFTVQDNLVASLIAVRADGTSQGSVDNFKILSINVAAIPEASSFLALGLVAAGFGGFGRRV